MSTQPLLDSADLIVRREQEFRKIKFDGKPRRVKPLLDPATLTIPDGISLCGLCEGHAQFIQRWCDAPASPGACDMCGGAQFVYTATAKPVPRSVRDQIETTNPSLVKVSGGWTSYRVNVDYGGRLFQVEPAIARGASQ